MDLLVIAMKKKSIKSTTRSWEIYCGACFLCTIFWKKTTKPWLNHDQHVFYNGIPVISVLGNWIYNCSPLAFPSLSVPPKILEAWMASSLAGTSTKPIAGGGPANQETVRKMKRSQESCDYPPSKTKRITLQVVATPKYKSFQPNDFDYNPPIRRKKGHVASSCTLFSSVL